MRDRAGQPIGLKIAPEWDRSTPFVVRQARPVPLSIALAEYRRILDQLPLDRDLMRDEALALLEARDRVDRVLRHADGARRSEVDRQLRQLDRQLRGWGDRLCGAVDLNAERRKRRIPRDRWWWFVAPSPAQWRRFDPIAHVLSAVLLTGSAGLIVDISAKFLVPGVDIVGSLAVAGQSAIALVTGSTLVTQTGQSWLKRRLIALGIRDRYWHEAGCVGSLALLLVLVGVRQFGFPWLADCYTRWGEKAYRQHRLETAGEHYDRALLFESDAIAARYLSGRLADEVDDRAAAQRQYWLAVQTDPGKDASMDDWKYYLQAASNLSRLYLLNKDPERAAQIAQDALDAIAPYPALDRVAVLDDARYGLYKNLGWARYARDRDGAAESWLQRAIAIAEATDREDGGVAARCLLAKVLDRFGDYAEALPYWERCAADAGRLNRTPEEDAWSGQAAARLADPTAQPAKPSASSPY